jgi:hypothetical protein
MCRDPPVEQVHPQSSPWGHRIYQSPPDVAPCCPAARPEPDVVRGGDRPTPRRRRSGATSARKAPSTPTPQPQRPTDRLHGQRPIPRTAHAHPHQDRRHIPRHRPLRRPLAARQPRPAEAALKRSGMQGTAMGLRLLGMSLTDTRDGTPGPIDRRRCVRSADGGCRSRAAQQDKDATAFRAIVWSHAYEQELRCGAIPDR